jgi:radical SAM protein with 4Fe4S-binding SPASM domain
MPRKHLRAFFRTIRFEGPSKTLAKSVHYVRKSVQAFIQGPDGNPLLHPSNDYGRIHECSALCHGRLSIVVVEITTLCNLRCPGCLRTVRSREGHRVDRHMSVDEFQHVIDQLPGAEILVVQGYGEPTLHPRLSNLIRIAREADRFRAIHFTSNGLAKQPEYYRELCEAGLTQFDISVDTLDQNLADRVRTGTDIPLLETRLRQFSRIWGDDMGVRIVARAENIEYIPAMLDRLNMLGSFTVFLQPYWDLGYPAGQITVIQRRALVTKLEHMKEKWPRLCIQDLEVLLPAEEICPLPWNSPAITVEGNVAPCCALMHNDAAHFGSIFQTPFFGIWHSEALADFRSMMEQQTPEVCRSCPRAFLPEKAHCWPCPGDDADPASISRPDRGGRS